jgi:hypothetical protein
VPANTTERLRGEIDRGRTGDKVKWPDPAAAPLGTDDEAGGYRPAPGEIARARSAELSRSVEPTPKDTIGAAWVLIAFVAACILALVIWASIQI